MNNTFALIVCASAASAASAATFNYVGTDFNNVGGNPVQDWRTPTVPKGFDLDGDNIYGSAGYLLFGTTDNSEGFEDIYPGAANLFTADGTRLDTLNNLPSWFNISDAGNAPTFVRVFGGNFYPEVDDPSNPGSDTNIGYGGYWDFGAGTPNDWFANIFSIALNNAPGANNPNATIRVGFLMHNNVIDQSVVAPKVIGVGDDAVNAAYGTNFAGNFGFLTMFYDISGYGSSDAAEVFARTFENTNDLVITGITLDVVVPTPGAGMLAGLGLACVAGRRRR